MAKELRRSICTTCIVRPLWNIPCTNDGPLASSQARQDIFQGLCFPKTVTKMAVAKLGQSLLTKARPHLNTSLKYAKAELTPPKLSDIPQITAGINNLLAGLRTGRWKQLTVKEAWLNTLVATEVGCWFFIGECIGRMHFVGYLV